MKKLLSALIAMTFFAHAALADGFPPVPFPPPSTSGTGSPGGTDGQVQIKNGSAFSGVTISGDASLNAATGALTVGSIGGKTVSLGGALSTTGAATPTLAFPASGTPVYTFPSGGGTLLSGLAYPLTVSGTVNSGGVSCATSTASVAISATLAANALMIGGGAGACPSTITTGAGVATMLGNAPNASGGAATITGATASGNLPSFSGANAALQDSGLSVTSISLSAANGLTINSNTSNLFFTAGGNTWAFSTLGNLRPNTSNAGTLGGSSNWLLGTFAQSVNLEGSSTGYDIIQSGNTGVGNWTYKTPPATGTGSDTFLTANATQTITNKSIVATQLTGTLQAAQEPAHTGDMTNTAGSLSTVVGSIGGKTVTLGGALTTTGAATPTLAFGASGAYTYAYPAATDTVAVLGQAQTFSGALTHSGANTFTGAFPASAAANTTAIAGGSTVPTMGSAGYLAIGGNYATSPTLSTTAQGVVNVGAVAGLVLQGDGSTYDVSLIQKSGAIACGVPTGTTNFKCVGSITAGTGGLTAPGITNSVSAHLAASGTAPTVTSGFGTTQGTIGTVNGTFMFEVNTNVGGTAGVVGLPPATTRWKCHGQSENNPTTIQVIQTAYGTSSATFAPYTLSGTLSAWVASDIITISCWGN